MGASYYDRFEFEKKQELNAKEQNRATLINNKINFCINKN
jgi:hypothetical protein